MHDFHLQQQLHIFSFLPFPRFAIKHMKQLEVPRVTLPHTLQPFRYSREGGNAKHHLFCIARHNQETSLFAATIRSICFVAQTEKGSIAVTADGRLIVCFKWFRAYESKATFLVQFILSSLWEALKNQSLYFELPWIPSLRKALSSLLKNRQ